MKWSQCYSSIADSSIALPRFGHSAVCVANTNWGSDLVVVYGGVGSASGESAQTALGDVLVLQVDNGTWSAPDILPGSSPGARAFHCAAALGSRVLVFGGHILTFEAGQNRKRRTFFNDVWQLDTDDWQWSKLAVDMSTAHPPGRDMAAWVLLDDSSLLLFGGRSETGKSLQDVWLFDVGKCSWRQLKPDGALPPPRKMHSMVKLGSQVLLFGGERDSGPLNDLWVLRGWQPGATPRWTQIKMKASPSPRFGHSLAVDFAGPVATSETAAADAYAGSNSSAGGADDAAVPSPASKADPQQPDTAASVAVTMPKSSSGGDGSAAFGQERVVLFGGCLDLSSFLSLNRNYVQSKEAWLLDMNNLVWVQVSSVNESGSGPSERMCHSLTTLSDGRMLLLGGRHKEGICRDMWWLEMSDEAPLPSPSSAAAAAAAANTSSGGSQQQASGASTPTRPASQSLLQSLLGPIRQRDSSQGQQQPAAVAAAAAPSSTSCNASESLQLRTPDHPQQQHQDLLQLDDSPAQAAAAAGIPAAPISSSSATHHQQQQPHLPAAAAGAAAVQPAAEFGQQPAPAPPPYVGTATPQGLQQSSTYSNDYSGYSGSSSAGQPLAALMDSSGELAKLIRNPAAYSADAINKLSSSVTSTVSSLQQQLPGALAGALPAALQRVAPSLLSPSLQARTNSSGSGGNISTTTDMQQANPASAALRAQLGLPPVPQQPQQQATAAGPCMAPGLVLQELARLGQQLLGDDSNDFSSSSSSAQGPSAGAAAAAGGPGRTTSGSFTTSSSLPPDVLVAAARQHLMSTAVAQLHIAQVALLLADYQHLAAAHYEQQMLSRLCEGFSAAAGNSASYASTFLQRQPHDLLLHQVEQLQAEYKQLITDTPE